MRTVSIVGLGYMGLPTALLIAKSGKFEVIGVDLSAEKVERLNRGELPFVEEGLPELFEAGRAHFRATTKLGPSDAFVLALPTPLTEDKRCDTSAIDAAVEQLVGVLAPNNLVVLESTVSPGTSRALHANLVRRCGFDVAVSYVSEKAIPGDTLREMVHNDRIVGVFNEQARERTLELYATFVKGELCLTDATSAETAKLLENTFRDVNIALANEFAGIAAEKGVDAHEVIRLANRHPRVNVLSPGPGVGGHCIAIDPWFLVERTEAGRLIRAAREINDQRPLQVVDAVVRESVAPGKMVILGTAYKKGVDDDRESPAYTIAAGLRGHGFEVVLHDPHVKRDSIETNLSATLGNAQGVVLVTDHDEYRDIDCLGALPDGAYVCDTRGLWDAAELVARGWRVGRLGAGRHP